MKRSLSAEILRYDCSDREKSVVGSQTRLWVIDPVAPWKRATYNFYLKGDDVQKNLLSDKKDIMES